MDNFADKERKEPRKNHIVNKQKNKQYVDDDIRFESKAKKVRKSRLEEIREEELYDEWEEYFK